MWKWFAGLVIFLVLESAAILMPDEGWLGVVANSLSAALLVVAVVWFLRRRAAREAAASPAAGKAPVWVSLRDRTWFIATIVIVVVASGVGHAGVKSSDAYKLAMATARNAGKFTEVLGAPVSEGWFADSVFSYGEVPTADLEVSVSGPKARGVLRVSASKTGDSWHLRRLTLHPATTSEEINLMQ